MVIQFKPSLQLEQRFCRTQYECEKDQQQKNMFSVEASRQANRANPTNVWPQFSVWLKPFSRLTINTSYISVRKQKARD